MKKVFYILSLLSFTTGIYSQANLEVEGKAKITQMEIDNSADSVVVRQTDGTLAIRDVATLTEFQILTISNDTVFLSSGGFIKLPPEVDGSTTNELQTISRTGLAVTLSDGGGTFQDSVLTETDVDDMVSDNGFLTSEIDGSITNELQTISRTGLAVTLSDGGGTFQDSVLTETDVDDMVSDNGFLTSEVDGSITNELQTISRTGLAVTLSDGGGTFQDSVLTETDVDDMVSDNGYLTSEVDGSTTNELQTISRTGLTVTLSDGGGTFQDSVLTETDVDDMVSDNGYLTNEIDGSTTNELQTISRTGLTVTLSDGGGTFQDSVNVYTAGGGIDITNNVISATSGSPSPWYLGKDTLGGIVFYIYKGDDGMEHGLVVAKTESTAQWQDPTSSTNATRTWDGVYNMNLMTNSPAKTYVQGLGAGWYLPSIDELSILWHSRFHTNKALFDGGHTLLSTTAIYWSSTEVDASNAFYFIFFYGSANTYALDKVNSLSVRGIRAF